MKTLNRIRQFSLLLIVIAMTAVPQWGFSSLWKRDVNTRRITPVLPPYAVDIDSVITDMMSVDNFYVKTLEVDGYYDTLKVYTDTVPGRDLFRFIVADTYSISLNVYYTNNQLVLSDSFFNLSNYYKYTLGASGGGIYKFGIGASIDDGLLLYAKNDVLNSPSGDSLLLRVAPWSITLKQYGFTGVGHYPDSLMVEANQNGYWNITCPDMIKMSYLKVTKFSVASYDTLDKVYTDKGRLFFVTSGDTFFGYRKGYDIEPNLVETLSIGISALSYWYSASKVVWDSLPSQRRMFQAYKFNNPGDYVNIPLIPLGGDSIKVDSVLMMLYLEVSNPGDTMMVSLMNISSAMWDSVVCDSIVDVSGTAGQMNYFKFNCGSAPVLPTKYTAFNIYCYDQAPSSQWFFRGIIVYFSRYTVRE